MSQLTTHILDTSIGKPAKGVKITLLHYNETEWQELASGITNMDGRISDLLDNNAVLELGRYKMVFDTKRYFETQNLKVFYPSVSIEFEVFDNTHYHIPLLLNPFGYSTYRGS
jgi:hydroxyisourate hydrolase